MPSIPDLKARYDVVVIGGGVHGAAVVLEATRLGYDALLVEAGDFCSSTSANTLKIIHGGLRYLQSGDIRRSRESAREQSELLDLAPHLVRPLSCLMGTERSVSRGRLTMALALWFYDRVVCAGLPPRKRSRWLTIEELGRIVDRNPFEHCTGAASWQDAQVVDAERLVLTYLKSAERAGAHILNYAAVTAVVPGEPNTVEIRGAATTASRSVDADVVIDTASFVSPHQGWARAVNLVLNREPAELALGLKLGGTGPDSGRLFFATPLAGRTIVGTWYFPDRPDSPDALHPSERTRCLSDARELLPGLAAGEAHVSRIHLGRLPVRDVADPLSLLERPVVRALGPGSRVICITGVKYTMARPTARQALRAAGLAGRGEPRRTTPWYGAGEDPDLTERAVRDSFESRRDTRSSEPVVLRLCRQYGSVAGAIVETAGRVPNGFERIPGCDGIRAEIDYCIEREYCRTLADFLLRRSGIGSLGPPPDAAVAFCADVMSGYFGWDAARRDAEVADLASHYQGGEDGA